MHSLIAATGNINYDDNVVVVVVDDDYQSISQSLVSCNTSSFIQVDYDKITNNYFFSGVIEIC